jgi:hypothetical protein
MKRNRGAALAAAALVTLTMTACSTGSPGTGTTAAPGAREASGRTSLPDLVSMLSGRFRGTTPGNGLSLDLNTVDARAGTRFDLFLTAMGRYRDRNVRRAGLLRLSTQGRDIHAAYIPHFDPTVSALSSAATRFTEDELRAACDFYFAPAGDGYFAETRGSTSCAQAMPGAVGKWTIEVEPGAIRVRNAESGETMRFAKTT